MSDQLAALRAQERSERMQQANSQLNSGPNEAPQPPVAPFSNSNEKWLADSVNELRQKDADYARLTSEQSRQEWEQIARANIQRKAEQSGKIELETLVDKEQQRSRDELNDLALLQQHAEIGATLPDNWNPNTLPLEKLRAVANITQKLGKAAERLAANPADAQPQPREQRPETFPDGSLYQLTNLADGNIEVKLITGERFVGDPITVTRTIAESNVHTKRWAYQQRGQQPQTQHRPLEQQQQPLQAEVPEDSFGTWAANESARALGFSDHTEMIRWGQEMTAFKEDHENHRIAQDFLVRNPDYPNTPEAEEALTSTIEKMGWQFTPDSMSAAHAYAVRNGLYRPLSPDEQRAALGIEQPTTSRQSPPPMLNSRAPDSQQQHDNNPYAMPLADLRKLAIQNALGGQS